MGSASPPAAPAPTAPALLLEPLEQLGALHEQGILPDEEFAAQTARLLGT